ncbi:hypothetical protein RIF29_18396 [Crotalaria pallida]|uniref:Enhancer of polycomb-like protein n=1 Tax=Crotalaria pallida TaxID=3830 RepID=A0AAN9FPU5_CROPI
MRRTTRIFGLVTKGAADSARVLRSGRRLWPQKDEPKTNKKGKKGDDDDRDKPPPPAPKTATKATPENAHRHSAAAAKTKRKEADGVAPAAGRNDNDVAVTRQRSKKSRSSPAAKATTGNAHRLALAAAKTKRKEATGRVVASRKDDDDDDVVTTWARKRRRCMIKKEKSDDGVDRRFGLVYSRKRKRLGTERSELSRKNKKVKEESDSGCHSVLGAIVKANGDWFSGLLVLILRYIRRRASVRLGELSAFLLSYPISGVFASRGVQFLQGPPPANIGVCQLFGVTQFIPLFCVDFSAVPLYFEHLHSVMLLKSMFTPFFLVHNQRNMYSEVKDMELETDIPEFQSEQQISSDALKRGPSETVAPNVIETNDSLSLQSSVNSSMLAGQSRQCRGRGRGNRGRRMSLRKRGVQNPSPVGLSKSNWSVASDSMAGRKSNLPLSGVSSSKKRRSLANRFPVGSLKEASSVIMADSTEGLDSSLCSANILVTESDQCYRVEGVIVTLEMSASREWLLFVKKDGLTRYTFKADKVMRPCSSNQFTQVILFSLDNGWMLEFANHQDWIVFEGLYKECSDRIIPASATNSIPIPGVREVFGYADSNSFTFHRPDIYISANSDELSRAMTRKTANYDMDSEDEEWLNKCNNEFQEHISEDNFELIIDALEKLCYCNPDYSLKEKSVPCGCEDLGSKEGIEAVYSYWMRKRKRRRSFLLRVFQVRQSKKPTLTPKPSMRKRRPFRRQPSWFGRSNQPSLSKAEQDALEEAAMHRFEEANASAKMRMELAIEKRKRAQSLAENVDLAIYRATMSVREAEAVQAAESANAAADLRDAHWIVYGYRCSILLGMTAVGCSG